MARTRRWSIIGISCFWLHKVLQQSRFTRPVTVRFILKVGPYIVRWSTHYKILGEESQLAGGRYHLGRFPNLQHLEIYLLVDINDNNNLFPFLNQLLSISSPTSLLETLTITICWQCDQEHPGDPQALLSPNSGWSTLEKTLTSSKLISLRQVSFKLDIETMGADVELESRRSLARPYINALFPMLRAMSNTKGTLEINIETGS